MMACECGSVIRCVYEYTHLCSKKHKNWLATGVVVKRGGRKKVVCECGSSVTGKSIYRHRRTAKHRRWVEHRNFIHSKELA